MLLLALSGRKHLPYDLIVLVEEQRPGELLFLFSLERLCQFFIFFKLYLLVSQNSIYVGLVSGTLRVARRLSLDWLAGVLLLGLHQLTGVVLLGDRVPCGPCLALHAAWLHRVGLDLAADVCMTPEVCDAVPGRQAVQPLTQSQRLIGIVDRAGIDVRRRSVLFLMLVEQLRPALPRHVRYRLVDPLTFKC